MNSRKIRFNTIILNMTQQRTHLNDPRTQPNRFVLKCLLGFRVTHRYGLRTGGNEVTKALTELITARQSQPAPFHFEEIARDGRIAFELGALAACFGALKTVADLFAQICQLDLLSS